MRAHIKDRRGGYHPPVRIYMYSLEFNVILMLVIGYIFGSIPVGFLYCKAHGVNIFETGSGNPGSTNVGRILGKNHGRIVFVLDIIKTLIPILIAHLVIIKLNMARNSVGFSSVLVKNFSLNLQVLHKNSLRDPFVIFATGFGAIWGHNYPFTTGFRGGKGITCTVAVLAYFNVIFAVVLFIIHKIIGKLTGYVSLASIIALIVMFLSALIMSIFKIYPFNFDYAYAVLPGIFCMMLLGIIRHKENILRLEHGTENKI